MARQARFRALGPLFLAVAGGACATHTNVRFAPAIQDSDLRGEANDVQAHVAVAWRGIEERDGVPELGFRVRVDNPGPATFTLVPAEFELLDAGLTSLGTVGSDGIPVLVEAGTSATFDITFPARESLDAFDLSVITLHTRLQGSRWSWRCIFERLPPEPGPPVSFGFGASVGF